MHPDPKPVVPPTLSWVGGIDGRLRILDQTLLPAECREIDLSTPDEVCEAIRSLRVRGAPAIGVAAAYGIVLGARMALDQRRPAFDVHILDAAEGIRSSRPTAVNLAWAVDRMTAVFRTAATDVSPRGAAELLLMEARQIEAEDREMCAAIGRHGASLLRDGTGVLTHCNAGRLATAGDGTALAVIYAATAEGKRLRVFAGETRPLLQGARLTAWELSRQGIETTLICDSAAGSIMKQGAVQAVVTGADRIAANGDTANKIGTYGLAVLARAHSIPFYVAAPASTFDLELETGDGIPIEERSALEVVQPFGRRIAPAGIDVRNPAFDVTPAELITAFITDRGLVQPVTPQNIRKAICG